MHVHVHTHTHTHIHTNMVLNIFFVVVVPKINKVKSTDHTKCTSLNFPSQTFWDLSQRFFVASVKQMSHIPKSAILLVGKSPQGGAPSFFSF